jgi:hypothetical protein
MALFYIICGKLKSLGKPTSSKNKLINFLTDNQINSHKYYSSNFNIPNNVNKPNNEKFIDLYYPGFILQGG